MEIKGSRCIFLIPVDRGALVGHIKGALHSEPHLDPGSAKPPSNGDGGSVQAAKDYLDKFFNLDLLLTRPEPIDIREWALGQALEVLPNDEPEDLRLAVQMIASVAGTSPRTVKRIINGVSSRHRLLGPNLRPPLAQIALVECILALAPSLLKGMADEPRHMVNAREDRHRTPIRALRNS